MRSLLPCLLLGLLLGCDQKQPDNVPDYAALSRQYLDAYYASNPETAVYLGLHAYDGKLNVPTKAWWQQQRTQLARFDSAFARLDTARLSTAEQIDLRLLRANIGGQLYAIDSLRAPEDPYTYGVDFSSYVERTFGTPTGRMQSVINKARLVPDYVDAAKQNIGPHPAGPPPAKEPTEVAIDALNGTADYLLGDVRTAFDTVGTPDQRAELASATKLASDALHAFATYLEKTVLPRATGTYAIGKANFRLMLRYNEQLEADPDSLLRLGMAQLKREQIEFANAARIIDPTKSAPAVFRAMLKDHPTAETLVSSTQAHCEAIRQFLLDKAIVSVPSEVRATVVKTPEFMVGSTAAMNTPGPFEKEATQAYYYITLPKRTWPAREQEEWLTQYNRYVAEVISIHEAYPGHYVQFLHLNASKASEVRKVFGSYAFIEGWAHYTEQMMLEAGYPDPKLAWRDPKTAAKYRMAQLSESLLRYCRLVCAINLHTHGWTVEQATQFIRQNAYYEEKPAYEEAVRGTYDPGYLSYSLGKLQLLALREEYHTQEGNAFSLQRFHDAVLAQGMLPVSELRRILL
jgi:uncharacterized protein (DUF885 family)